MAAPFVWFRRHRPYRDGEGAATLLNSGVQQTLGHSLRIGLLITLVSLAALPVGARGGGGHGGGGHGGGGHCAGAHGGGGRDGATHGGPEHRSIGHFVGRGRAAFGNGGYFGSDTSDFGASFLDRIDATPQPSAPDDLDGSGADKRWSSRPSTAEEEAQYRYDHRGGGD